MRLLYCILLVLVPVSLFAEIPTELKQKHTEMLYPAVRVTYGSGGGSGTILYSEDRGDGTQTFILTNHHVIEGAIQVKTEWSSLLQSDVKRETNDPVKVEIFRYAKGSQQDITDACHAEIVAHDRNHDLALLKLKTDRKFEHTAKLLPPNVKVHIFQSQWAIGCSLLHPPVATKGMISYLDDVIDKKNYWMGSAQIIFGNSGGAVYVRHEDHYYFIGVPSRVAGTWGQVVTHMGWFVPITRLRDWFKDEKLDFLVDAKAKPSESFKLREAKKSEAERKKLFEKALKPGD